MCVTRSGRSPRAWRPKNSKSPFLSWLKSASNGTAAPSRDCEPALCGRSIPFRKKTCWTNPEQSNPFVELPPHRYGRPRNFRAVRSMFSAVGRRDCFHAA